MPIVLNVGAGEKATGLPPFFNGWTHHRLDIDPACHPDVVADARELETLPAGTHDAIYCSHNLEHFYHHDAKKVVRGFAHVLKQDGFVQIRVPDILALMRHVVVSNMDVDDVLYQSHEGPIKVRDVFYGFQARIEQSGTGFYAHKTCFSAASLEEFMEQNGFPVAVVGNFPDFEVIGFFFKQEPTPAQCKLLDITRV